MAVRLWSFRVLFAPLLVTAMCACGQNDPGLEQAGDEEKAAAIEEMYQGYRSDFPSAPELSVQEFLELREAGDILLVDVRNPEERAVSGIAGAITKEELEARKKEGDLPPVIAYCTIGYRSGQYVEELTEEGVDAYNLKGSILSWVHAGQPVVDPQGNETKRVHVFGSRWNLLPGAYEAVW